LVFVFPFLLKGQSLQCNWAYLPQGGNFYNAVISDSKIDQQGDIVQLGRIFGVADLDPGTAATDTSFSHPGYNYYVLKMDISGHLLWVKYFRGIPSISTFEFNGLAINSQNEIIVLGNYFGMIDFDLSDSGVDTLRSHQPTYEDFFIAKYDAMGNYLWANNIGDATNRTVVKSMTLSANDEILVTTDPIGAVDMDPSNAVHNTIGGNANLICYDNNGNYVWHNNIVTTYSYGVDGKTLSADGFNNTYLFSVGYYELTVNKFSQNGGRIWDKTIGDFTAGARVTPQSILADTNNGGFYVCGTFEGSVDFDPGPAVVTRTSTGFSYQDLFVAKYDSTMNLLWVNAFAGEGSFGKSSLEYYGNDLVLCGQLTGSIDFGSGFILNSNSIAPFYLKLSTSGITLDAFVLNGGGAFQSIQVSQNNQMVMSGYVFSVTDMDPSAAVLNLTPSNATFFTSVYEPIPNSLLEPSGTIAFSVFPNPSIGGLYITSKGGEFARVKIMDALGRLVYQSNSFLGTNYIDLSGQNEGIYFVHFQDGQHSQVVKRIILTRE